MANKTYIVENANNPIESDFYKDIIQKDANGNPLVDSQNRIRVKRYVVHGSVGLNEASVDAKINTAKSEINSTIADLHHVTTDTTQTVSGNKTFTGETRVPTVDSSDSSTKAASTAFVQGKVTALQNTLNTFLDSDDATLDQASELVAAIKANKTDIASLVADKATKAELAEIAEKSNAITVSNTAPDTSNMTNASGVLHPSSDVITENPDVSILALQNDMWVYDATKTYAVGSYVFDENKDICKCIQANGPTNIHAPSDSAYWLRVALNSDLGIITGKIEWFAFNTPPEGYLVCNGATVSRETYADLFAVIGTTYGSGDGSTTFTLPNLIDKFVQGSTTVGTYKSAGLPNITGYYDYFSNQGSPIGNKWSNYNGALYTRSLGIGDTIANGGNYDNIGMPGFDASKSNSIYGNSATVQPPALTLLPCIKY